MHDLFEMHENSSKDLLDIKQLKGGKRYEKDHALVDFEKMSPAQLRRLQFNKRMTKEFRPNFMNDLKKRKLSTGRTLVIDMQDSENAAAFGHFHLNP